MTTTSEVDEHPIIFKGWSVRRILAGEKTQTRRTSGLDRVNEENREANFLSVWRNQAIFSVEQFPDTGNFAESRIDCPYGQPGDVLWVREAFRLSSTYDDHSPREYVDRFPIGGLIIKYEADSEYNAKPSEGWGRLRSPIHMPRELCRLRLRVEDVDVERVQEIDADGLHAEGIPRDGRLANTYNDPENLYFAMRKDFQNLWNDIHGEGAWERNPWVWKISFSKIEG